MCSQTYQTIRYAAGDPGRIQKPARSDEPYSSARGREVIEHIEGMLMEMQQKQRAHDARLDQLFSTVEELRADVRHLRAELLQSRADGTRAVVFEGMDLSISE